MEEINDDNLRSTDLYPIIARKKLIERDKNNGSNFRRFLRDLKDKVALHLIQQCKYQHSRKNPEHLEWHFYRTKNQMGNIIHDPIDNELILPKLAEEEINKLIVKGKAYVQSLPKKDSLAQ